MIIKRDALVRLFFISETLEINLSKKSQTIYILTSIFFLFPYIITET